jgi:hypothetical protein
LTRAKRSQKSRNNKWGSESQLGVNADSPRI